MSRAALQQFDPPSSIVARAPDIACRHKIKVGVEPALVFLVFAGAIRELHGSPVFITHGPHGDLVTSAREVRGADLLHRAKQLGLAELLHRMPILPVRTGV